MSIRKIFVKTWQNKLLMSGGKRKKICLLFLPVLFSWPVWTFVILAIFQYIVSILYLSLWYFPNRRIFIFNLWPGKMSKLHFCGQMSDVLELDTCAIYLFIGYFLWFIKYFLIFAGVGILLHRLLCPSILWQSALVPNCCCHLLPRNHLL